MCVCVTIVEQLCHLPLMLHSIECIILSKATLAVSEETHDTSKETYRRTKKETYAIKGLHKRPNTSIAALYLPDASPPSAAPCKKFSNHQTRIMCHNR